MALKEKTVISADPAQILLVREIVESGRYRSVSDFVRKAIGEQLAREFREALEEEVGRYAAAGHDREETDLVSAQAWEARKVREKR